MMADATTSDPENNILIFFFHYEKEVRDEGSYTSPFFFLYTLFSFIRTLNFSFEAERS